MATLLFAGAGAAIGSFVAGGASVMLGWWTAAQWGWNIGSLIGMFVQSRGNDPPPIEIGPKQGDLKPTVSSYGLMLPIAEGTTPAACNVIWTTDYVLHETVTTQETGGKFDSPEQTIITRWRTVSFAAAICEAPPAGIKGITKIKLNGHLVASTMATESTLTVLSGLAGINIYNGSSTQQPSALQESYLGAGNVPAYRRTAYIEFQDLDLTPYNNEFPRTIEVEVVVEGTDQTLTPLTLYTIPSAQETTPRGLVGDAGSYRPIENGALAWVVLLTAGAPRKIALVNNYTFEEIVSYTAASGAGNTGFITIFATGLNGRVWFQEYNNGIVCMDTSGAFRRMDEPSFLVLDGDTRCMQTYETAPIGTTEEDLDMDTTPDLYFLYNAPTASVQSIYRISSINLNTLMGGSTSTIVCGQGIGLDRINNNFAYNADGIPDRLYVYANRLSPSTPGTGRLGYINTLDGTVTILVTYTRDDMNPVCLVDPAGYLYVRSANNNEANVLEKRNADTGALIDTVLIPGLASSDYAVPVSMAMDNTGHLFLQVRASNKDFHYVNLGTFEVEDTTTGTGNSWQMAITAPFLDKGVLVTRTGEAGDRDTIFTIDPIPRITPTYPTHQQVAERLMQRREVGLTAGDMDMSGISSKILRGMLITSRQSCRSILEMLALYGQWDGVESDYKIKGRLRGTAAVTTIGKDNLGARQARGSDPPEPIHTNSLDPRALPKGVDVTYMSLDNFYLIGTQSGSRQTVESEHKITVNFPFVMFDSEAWQLAHILTYLAWIQRDEYETDVSLLRHTEYEPADPINFLMPDGTTRRARMTEKGEGVNNIMRIKAVGDLAEVYTQPSYATSAAGMNQSLNPRSPTDFAFLDIHLLRNVDDNPGVYVGGRGYDPESWGGYVLHLSKDGTSFIPLAETATTTPAAIGFAQTILPAIPEGTEFMFDLNSTIDVFLPDYTMQNWTRDQIMNGDAEVYCSGKEIFYAMTAAVVGTNVWRLSKLLRGRKGTGMYMDTHVAGERFAVLNTLLRSLTMDMEDVNRTYQYKAVTQGSTLAATSRRAYRNTGLRSKPLPVIDLGVSARGTDGTIRASWTRQTRFNNPWRDGADAPLGETSEKYLVTILDGTDVLREEYSTVPYFDYTPDMQITDWGGLVLEFGLRVQQVGEYGLGYPCDLAASLHPSVAARYWRIVGLTTATSSPFEPSELQFLVDGVRQLPSAASSSNTPSGPLSNLYNDTYTAASSCQWTKAIAEAPGFFIRYDLGSAKLVNGVKQGFISVNTRFMTAFTLQYSIDDVVWNTVGSKSGLTYEGSEILSSLYAF